MNHQRLAASLSAIHADPTLARDADTVYRALLSTPIEDVPQQRTWLPRIGTWSFKPMFSATKFVVAGAIVALFGGFLLAGVLTQPSDEQGASLSGAATDDGPMAPVYVKAHMGEQTGSHGTESETDEGMTRRTGGVMAGDASSTDPRLEGLHIFTPSYLEIDEETNISMESNIIFNDGGSWIGTTIEGWSADDSTRAVATVVLSGTDGYEGLTALLWNVDDQSEYELGGVIFEGDMPAMPEDWCALARDDFPAAVARFPNDTRWIEDATRSACPSVEIPE